MRGVAIHINDPKMRTSYTTALKKVLDFYAFATSCPSIRYIRVYFFHALCRLAKTAGQSSSMDVRIKPMYFKSSMLVRGSPYALKYVYLPARASSTTNLCQFLSTPLVHWVVLGWWMFSSSQGISMSQRWHQGWGVFPSSTTNTVSCIWWWNKFNLSPI